VADLTNEQSSVYRCYLHAYVAGIFGYSVETLAGTLDEDVAVAIGVNDGKAGSSPRWSGALLATIRAMKDPALGAGGTVGG
jgi:hypothetical protein